MADNSFRRFYRRVDFVALALTADLNAGPLAIQINALALSTPVAEVRANTLLADGIVIEWLSLPTLADFAAIDAVVAAFVGGSTAIQPFVVTVNSAVTTTSATPTNVIDFTTPTLDAGTYQIIFSSQFRLTTAVAGEAARALFVVTASPAAAVTQQDHSGDPVVKAYNGAVTLARAQGQTMRVQLQIAEVGPGVATAEMTQARITIDRIG
jgi:hypothetical protein